MPPLHGMMHWHSLLARHAKSLKSIFTKGLQTLDEAVSSNARVKLEPVLVRNVPKQPLHPLARIRQSQSRWYSTTRKSLNSVRSFTSAAAGKWAGVKYDRSAFPKSVIGSRIQSSSGRAPFASTLRPNLTGGTIGRTAGGYTLGSGRVGGARYFSHGPASQAQVVQNVSQAVRAFFVSGQKARYDGSSPFSGEKRFIAVSSLQEETHRKLRSLPKAAPGSWIDFQLSPTITAVSPLSGKTGSAAFESDAEVAHINSEGLIDALSVDFSRALKDLAAIHNDVKRLSALGDLTITHEKNLLRVHFPGCDRKSVENLCEEMGIQRGIVYQDERFDSFVGAEFALLFPLAPSESGSTASESEGNDFYEKPVYRSAIKLDDMFTSQTSDRYSSQSGHGHDGFIAIDNTSLPSTLSGFESVRSGSVFDYAEPNSSEYQGFEGIYRFIEELDSVDRRR